MFDADALFHGAEAELIRFKASRICRSLEFLQHADREDIEQSLRLELWKRSFQFDAGRGSWRTFYHLVVDHCATTLFWTYARTQRWGFLGLSEPSTAADRHRADRAIDLVDLAIDVALVLGKLPHEEADILERLKWATTTQVARDLKLPRSTLFDAVRRMRRQFESRNLQKYLL